MPKKAISSLCQVTWKLRLYWYRGGKDELSMKFWVVAIADANVLVLGSLFIRDHFWALRLKLHLLAKAVIFDIT